MSRRHLFAALALAAAAGSVLTAPAQAATHGRFAVGRGPLGGGYFHSRQVTRHPGSTSVSRNTQGWGGRGVHSTRNASWGNGSYTGSASHSFNNGASTSRDLSLHRNSDGSASYDYSRTRLNGDTVSRSGTIDRPLH